MPTCGKRLLANKAELVAHTASDLRLPSCLSTVRAKFGLGKLALGAVLRVGGTGTTANATCRVTLPRRQHCQRQAGGQCCCRAGAATFAGLPAGLWLAPNQQ